MTVLEQKFMETVPSALRDIAKSLEAIAKPKEEPKVPKMTLAFYKVTNSKGYDRHAFDAIADKPGQIMAKLSKLPDGEVRMYDLNNYGYGPVPSPNVADLVEDYNDEEIDGGGWWCVAIRE